MQAQVLLRTCRRYLSVLPAQAGNAVQHIISYNLMQGLTLKSVSPSANKERLSRRKKFADYPAAPRMARTRLLGIYHSVYALHLRKYQKNKAGMPQQSLLYAI